MNLRNHLRLAALLPVLFALLIGSVLGYSWWQVERARAGAATADGILRSVVDVYVLAQEYLLYDSARAVMQLQKKHAVLAGQIAAANFSEPMARGSVASIRQSHADLDALVTLLLQSRPEFREQIASALLVKIQDLRARAGQLTQIEYDELVAIQHRADIEILLALAVLTLLSLAAQILLGRRLVQGMDRLAEGMRKVEGGDLNHVVPVSGNDELDALARSFNEMIRRLRVSTTSVERLQEEISQREQAEQAVRVSEEKFRYLFEYSPLGKSITKPSGLIHVNQAFCKLLGYSRQELEQSNWRDITHPDDIELTQQEIDPLLTADKEATRFVKRYLHKNGSVVWAEVSTAIRRDAEGQALYFLTTINDITERLQAEQEVDRLKADLEQRVIERTAELTAANRELDSFAYAVSHDLRAPLRAMSGFSQALSEDYGEQLQGEARVFLEQIQLASRKMSELIDGLLVLSRSTRGELEYSLVDLSALAEHLLAELAQGEPRRQVDVQVEAGLQAQGDPRMLEVVLRNLLDNAWKYSARVAAAAIRIYREERDGQCYFCVADNGAGFDMAHANRLFQPFQRLHRQEEFPGIGIGLATVQRIVHRHGGIIEARGLPGQGAVFCFSLTAASELAT